MTINEAVEHFRKRIISLMFVLTIDDLEALQTLLERHNTQTTHSDECWRWHIDCAVAKCERLEAENERLRHTIGHLVTLLGVISDSTLWKYHIKRELSKLGLTRDDAIGGDE